MKEPNIPASHLEGKKKEKSCIEMQEDSKYTSLRAENNSFPLFFFLPYQ